MIDTPLCADPLPLEELAGYGLGELAGADEQRVEEHLFACEACARTAESLTSLAAGIKECVRQGRVTAAVSGGFLDRAAEQGAKIRQYRLTPGATAQCTAAPDDDFVAIRLAGEFAGFSGLAMDIAFENLDTGERGSFEADALPADQTFGEVVLLHPGGVVRGYPRSQWTIRVRGSKGPDEELFGPYILDHTPWDRLPGNQ